MTPDPTPKSRLAEITRLVRELSQDFATALTVEHLNAAQEWPDWHEMLTWALQNGADVEEMQRFRAATLKAKEQVEHGDVKYRDFDYHSFKRSVELSESQDQVERIDGRIRQKSLITRLGKPVCDKMFERLKLEDAILAGDDDDDYDVEDEHRPA